MPLARTQQVFVPQSRDRLRTSQVVEARQTLYVLIIAVFLCKLVESCPVPGLGYL